MGLSAGGVYISTINQIATSVASAVGTFVKVGETTLAAPAAAVALTGIPNTYKFLMFHFSYDKDANAEAVSLEISGGVVGDHDNTKITMTDAASATLSTVANDYLILPPAKANGFGSVFGQISIIQGTSVRWIAESFANDSINTAGSASQFAAGRTLETTVDSIRIYTAGNNFAAGTRLTVYGVA